MKNNEKRKRILILSLFLCFYFFLFFLWNIPSAQAQEAPASGGSQGSASGPSKMPSLTQGSGTTTPATSQPGPPSVPAPPLPEGVIAPGLPQTAPEPSSVTGQDLTDITTEGQETLETQTEQEPGIVSGEAETASEVASEIELSLSGKMRADVSTDLKQFGYDLFQRTVSTFAPITDVPVGPDYIVGPGDRFTISLWGRIELAYKTEVDRNGEITLPKVGTLKVWGSSFSELKTQLKNELSKHYKGFEMNVVMDRLRSIRVFVVGEVRTPGSFTLSSLATVYNALFAAGGPSKRGTMRDIRLLRNGKVIRNLDLYNFLLRGDMSQDERLQSGDTVFVPMIGSVAGIAGNVKRPAIYEMKGEVTLGELFDLAGGVTPTGYTQRVQIERIIAHQKRIVEDLDLAEYPDTPQLKTILIL